MEKNANFVVPDISVVPFEKIINDYKNIIKGMTAEEFDSSFCFRKIMAKAGYKKLEEVFGDITKYAVGDVSEEEKKERKKISEETIRKMYYKDMVHDFEKIFWMSVFFGASFEDAVKWMKACKIDLQKNISKRNIYDEKYNRNATILQILYDMKIYDADIVRRVEEVEFIIEEWRPF